MITKTDILYIGNTVFEEYLIVINAYGTSFVCDIEKDTENRKKLTEILRLFGNYSIVDEYEIWEENGNDEPIPDSYEKVYSTNLPYSIIDSMT